MSVRYPREHFNPAGMPMARTRPFMRLVTASSLLGSCVLLSQACASPPSAASMAVMIDFKAPIDGASPELLGSLSRRAGVQVSYRAAVSPSRHAYSLACPSRDPDCRSAIGRLSADPRIRDLAADRLKSPIQDNR